MVVGSLKRAVSVLALSAAVVAPQMPMSVLAGPFDQFIEDERPPQRPPRPPQTPPVVRPERPPQRPQQRPPAPQRPPQRPPAQRPVRPPPPPPLTPPIIIEEETRPPVRPPAPPQPQRPPVRPPVRPQQPPPPPPPLGSIEDDWETIVIPAPDSEDDPKNKDQSRLDFERQNRPDLPMFVTRTAWNAEDEEKFGAFVVQMGQAIAAKKCNTVRGCFQSREANMYAEKDPKGVFFTADCADFPYLLRAYFAYHNGLPFGHVVHVRKNLQAIASVQDVDASDPKYELRYGPYGNSVIRRGFSTAGKKMGEEPNLIKYLTNMFNSVSTGTFRVSPLTNNYFLSDLYPVRIDRNGIKPGTVIHATGHVLVVWKVDERGRVHAIDANTQAGVSYKVLQPSTIDFTRPDQALGFFKFRPLSLTGATKASNGAYYGGKIAGKSDEALYQEGLYSLEQWFGPNSDIAPGSRVEPDLWRKAFKGQAGFFDFLTSRLRDANVIVGPDEVVGDMIDSLCEQFRQRLADVKSTLGLGIHRRQRPNELPADIFGQADPTWGSYSTPGRDGRLRASSVDIVKMAVQQYQTAKQGTDPSLRYNGSAEDYVAILRQKVAAVNRSCSITYVNSAGKSIRLSFNQLVSRLNKMSFDPYHCAEKRWGASGNELATCVDTDSGNEWYEAEKYMRNTVGKMTSGGVSVVRSSRPITLNMLRDKTLIDRPDSSDINLGTTTPPILNLDASFASPKFLELLNK